MFPAVVLSIVLSAAVLLVLGLIMTVILGWANETFHVEIDPRIRQVQAALPGANCGACGYLGCEEYAEAVAEKGESPDLCPVGGHGCAAKIAEIMGLDISESVTAYPVIRCGAAKCDKKGVREYHGEMTCTAASISGSVQGCAYGCLGLGDCVRSCNFDAIHLVEGHVVVDYDMCVSCGACARACPRNIIEMVPFHSGTMPVVACRNRDFGKDVKQVCDVGCIGCEACVKAAGDVFKMSGNLAYVDHEQFDKGASASTVEEAVEKCPTGCILMIRSDAENEQGKE